MTAFLILLAFFVPWCIGVICVGKLYFDWMWRK
jgi:hypothetical protein